MLSRATPVFTMFGFWTTPNNATVNNSPEERSQVSRSHEGILEKGQKFLWLTYDMRHQDDCCVAQETQRLRVHSHRPGDRKGYG